MSAEAVLRLTIRHKDLQLIAVIPFHGQEEYYSNRDKERYKTIYGLADNVVFICYDFHHRAYLDQNDYTLNNSSSMICYYTGLRGGTMYTYNRAKQRKLQIVNLAK